MPTSSPLSDRRALLVAKFEALLDECDLVADNAAYGEPLNDMEAFLRFKFRWSLRFFPRIDVIFSVFCQHGG